MPVHRKRLLLIKKKYTNLSGGKWITVTKAGSPLHGHHIYIDNNGTILAGAVPKSFHGKTIEQVHEMHGEDAPHPHMPNAHDIASKGSAEQTKEHITEAEANLSHAKDQKSASGESFWQKKKEIAEHHLQEKDPNHVIKRPIPDQAPYLSKKPIHNTYSKKTPAELKAIIAQAKENIKSGKGNAYDKKVITVASFYLNGGQKPDDSAFGAKKGKDPAPEEKEEEKEEEQQVAPEPEKEPEKTPESESEEDPGESVDVDENAPHKDKYPGTLKAVKDQSMLAIKQKQADLIDQMGKHIESGNKDYYNVAKEKLELANYYAEVAGASTVEGPEWKRPVPTSAPHPDSAFHDLLSDLSPEKLKETIKIAKEQLTNIPESAPSYKLKQKKIEVASHYLNGGKTPDKYDQEQKNDTALDDFHSPSNNLQTSNYEHTGKNIADLGINQQNPDHVYAWNEKIQHENKGYSASDLSSQAKKLMNMIENGDDYTGHTATTVDAKKKVQNNLGNALMHNDDFLALASQIHKTIGYDDYVSSNLDMNDANSRQKHASEAARTIIAKWAGTSADHDPLAVAMQIAAKEEFGLHDSHHDFESGTVDAAKDKYLNNPKINAGVRAFLREQYNQTQEYFKKNGITHVPILRGMGFDKIEPMKHIPLNTPTKTKMSLQPMSSFSASSSKAHDFTGSMGTGGGGPNKLMIAAMVPVERILGCPQTGYGCKGEHEYVVLGQSKGHDEFVCYGWKKGQPGSFHHADMFKYMADLGESGVPASNMEKAPKAPPKTKKTDKEYHVKSYIHGTYTPAVNAKQVINEHGVDAFVHKLYGGYQVNDGDTGVPITSKHATQKKAIEAAHWVMNNKMTELKEKLAKHPAISESMTKSLRKSEEGVIYADADPYNADWTKTSWDVDLAKPGTPEFEKMVKSYGGMDHFKTLPVYQYYIAKNKMKKSDDGYYPSDRHAYKTHTRDPIYLPLNRIQTPYQTEAALDESKIKENVRRIKNGEALSPVIIGYDYDLHDGHHRLEAAKRVGHSHVPCVVGGRNRRRVEAAEKRYRAVYKSMAVIEDGKLLLKQVASAKVGEKWITIRGNHVLIDGEGNILQGPPHLKGKKLAPRNPAQGKTEAKAKVRESWESQKKTPFDTKEIVEARAHAKTQIPTYKRDYFNSPERKAMRKKLIEDIFNNKAREEALKGPHGKVMHNKRCDLVIGPPAAGKSTALADPLAREHGSLIIDSDMAKEVLPEFGGGSGAGVVHEESAIMTESWGGLFHKAVASGANFVHPIVGKNPEKIRKLRDDLNAAGYEVHLHLNEVPKEVSTQRAIERFYGKSKRFVDPDYVYNDVGDKPSHAYEDLKKLGGFHSYEKVSNNVKYGEKPIVIERFKEGEQHGKASGSGRGNNGSSVSNNGSVPEGDRKEKVKKSFIDKAGRFLVKTFKGR